MNRMEDHITDGPLYEESTPERKEPVYDDEGHEYERHEPEDNFSLSVRLRMAINATAEGHGLDQRRLVQLFKDCKQMADSHTELCSKVEDATDELRESLLGKVQAE